MQPPPPPAADAGRWRLSAPPPAGTAEGSTPASTFRPHCVSPAWFPGRARGYAELSMADPAAAAAAALVAGAAADAASPLNGGGGDGGADPVAANLARLSVLDNVEAGVAAFTNRVAAVDHRAETAAVAPPNRGAAGARGGGGTGQGGAARVSAWQERCREVTLPPPSRPTWRTPSVTGGGSVAAVAHRVTTTMTVGPARLSSTTTTPDASLSTLSGWSSSNSPVRPHQLPGPVPEEDPPLWGRPPRGRDHCRGGRGATPHLPRMLELDASQRPHRVCRLAREIRQGRPPGHAPPLPGLQPPAPRSVCCVVRYPQ